MKTNTSGYQISERPNTIALPTVKNQSNEQINKNKKASFFKSLSHENLVSPDSHEIVQTWLLVQPESNKRVQFARDINNNERKLRRSTFDTMETLPEIDQDIYQLDLTSLNQSDNTKDGSSKHHNSYLASISDPKLYRTLNNKTLSISTSATPSLTRSRHSSFISNIPSINHRPPSVEHSLSILSTSTNKDRLSNLTLLEFNSSLSEIDQKKFDDIRQQVPEEFEQLLPTLLKLGVVLWPKKFFDNKEQLTIKELKQRQRLIEIIEKDQENTQHKRHLTRLYGSVLPHDNILEKHQLLRENLSYQGQLSLLSAYRDEIENELTKKIQYWKQIPMKIIQTSLIDESNSLNRSSILSNTYRVKNKFLQPILSKKSLLNSNIYQLTNDELFSLTLPDNIDNQWQRKSLVKIIEQGMNILDQVRKLSQIHNEDYDYKKQIVLIFKRWLYLWTTLYTDDRCLR